MLRVVPWPGAGAPGYVNLHWRMDSEDKKKSFWGGRPFQTVENLLSMVNWCNERPATIKDQYFCLSLQSEQGKYSKGRATAKRVAANAMSLKAIWLDVDVKAAPKGYPTLEDALDAVAKFVEKLDLPPPSALVASGGGLHVYWISDRPLPVDEWMRYAEGLKQAAVSNGLRCDAGITTDCARILRVPGTRNFKTDPPRAVTLLGMRDTDYDFAVALASLATTVTSVVRLPSVTASFDLSLFPKRTAPAEGVESLAAGIEHAERPPLDFQPIVKGCPFYRDALINGGADHSQGLWNLAILGTTFLEKGETLAHSIGDKHVGYTPESTKAMYDRKLREKETRGLGWPRCSAIQAEGCKLCASCPHFGKIKSPLHLALQAERPAAVEVPPEALNPELNRKLALPEGYAVDKEGYICWVEEKETKEGETIKRLHQLFTCHLTDPWTEKTPVGDVLHFTTSLDWNEGKKEFNTKTVSLSLRTLKSSTELLDALLTQRVKPFLPNTPKIGHFVMAWVTELQKKMAAQQSLPYGWYVDEKDGKRHGFVFAGRLMKDDGTVTEAGHGDPQLASYYRPTGSIEPWFKAFHSITAQGRPELEIIVASAFAAPLMVTTGQYSGAFSAWGTTGAQKSTALKVAMSVWGHPKLTKETIKSTSKSVINKMGTLKNIPIFWDEIRDATVQTHLYDTVFGGGEGVEGGRLTSSVTQRARGDWQTTLVACSNISFVDFIIHKQRTTSAGVYRVFEFDVPKAAEDNPGRMKSFDAERMVQELEHNFGHMGLKYAAMLAADPEGVDETAYKIMERFSAEVNERDGERFWVASCSVILAGATFANLLGCNFNVDRMRAYLLDSYFKLRARLESAAVEGGTSDNTQEILTGWLRHVSSGSVWTENCHMGKGKPKAVTVRHGPSVDNSKRIYIQWAIQNRVCMFSRQEFNKYLQDNNYPPHSVIEGLRKHFGATIQKAKLCAGTPYRLPQEHLITIPIPEGHPLEEMLYAHGMTEETTNAA